MNKIVLNIKYKMRYQLLWAAWYPAIVVPVLVLLYYILIKTSVINTGSGSLVYRFWGAVLFQFAVSMKFKEDFDFLLTLSNTRCGIFLSLAGVAVVFSTAFSGLIVLERVIVDHLNNVFGYHHFTDPFHFFAPYMGSLFTLFVFFLALSVCVSMGGLLAGSLFYRFGRKFTVAFWLVLSSVPAVFVPILLWVFYQRGHLEESMSAIGAFFRNFNVPAGSGLLFILSIVFGMAAYLNIRRLPQK